jgi:hypothetical protein
MAAERGQPPADGDAPPACSRLAALQDRAADAYAAVTAADAELRALAGRRVAAERELRRALLAAGTDADTQADTQAGTGAALDDARRAAARLRDEFAARLAARAQAVTALRRLTADCAAARAEASNDAGAEASNDAGG